MRKYPEVPVMRTLVLPAVLAAGIAIAPLAQADSPETLYDQYMISHGEVQGAGANCAPANPNCGYTSEWLLAQGRAVCSGQATQSSLEGIADRAVAGNIVYAAHHFLCP